jgi:hypothetical protein
MALQTNVVLTTTTVTIPTNLTKPTPEPLYAREDVWVYSSLGFLAFFAVTVLILLLCIKGEHMRRRRRRKKDQDRVGGTGRGATGGSGRANTDTVESEPISLKNEVERLIQKGKMAQMGTLPADAKETTINRIKVSLSAVGKCFRLRFVLIEVIKSVASNSLLIHHFSLLQNRREQE